MARSDACADGTREDGSLDRARELNRAFIAICWYKRNLLQRTNHASPAARQPGQYSNVKIAVISDTHDHIPLLRRGAADAVEQGADAILHCGDIVAPSTLEKLIAYDVPVHAIHGNNQGDAYGFTRLVSRRDHRVTYYGQDADIELGGRRIFVVHFPHYARAMAATGDYDLVCCGHTHAEEAYQQDNLHGGSTLVLNPGTLGGVAASATYALVDLHSLRYEFREIGNSA
ncbi:MAG: metallophosphoesterase [Pseudomonadota bacterium]